MKWRVLILIVALMLSNGLLNYKELNELAIVSSVAIDKLDDESYEISVQVMNSKKEGSSGNSGSSGESQITVYTSSDTTVQAALRNMINESPKKLYLSHLNLLVISEEISKEGIGDCLDFFFRNTDINHEITIVIASGENSAKDVISTLTPVELNPTQNIYDSLNTAHTYGATSVNKTISKVQDELMKEYKETSIDSVEIQGDVEDGEVSDNIEKSQPDTKVLISKVAYFDKENLKGYISEDDAKIYNIIDNKIKNTIVQTKIEDNYAAFEIIESSAKCVPTMDENGFSIKISVKVKSNLSELKGKYVIDSKEKLDFAQECLSKKIENMINTYLYNIQNVYKCDISGFGDMLYKKYNLKFKNNSEGYLEKIKFDVNVESSLENEGGVLTQW